MWTIRVGRHFYAQGANPRWYGDPLIATHFDTDDDAHAEARDVLRLEPTDYIVEPCYPQKPRPANAGRPRETRTR